MGETSIMLDELRERVRAFEAAKAVFAFRDRLAKEHGGPFSDSTVLIREDRER